MCAVCRDAASAEIEGSGDRECTVAEPKLMAGYTDVVSIRTSVACVAPGGVRRQGGVDMYVEKRTFGFAEAGESLFPSSDVLNLKHLRVSPDVSMLERSDKLPMRLEWRMESRGLFFAEARCGSLIVWLKG